MILKFDSEKEYVDFTNNIRANTSVMPSIFSNYKAGFYSKIYSIFLVLMYANSNTWEHVKMPIHLKFYGVKINVKEKRYLCGIISDLWILMLPIIALGDLTFAKDFAGSFILILGFSLSLFLLRKEREEIITFMRKHL